MISNDTIVNTMVECMDYTRNTFESISSSSSLAVDTTPEKPSRQKSSDSIEGRTALGDNKKLLQQQHASPVSVTNIFDHYDTALQSIEPLPYIDDIKQQQQYAASYDDHVDELFLEQQQYLKSRQRKSQKRVRFLLDEDGEIEEGVSLYSYPDYKITPKLKKECWYTKDDRIRTKQEIQLHCRDHNTTMSYVEEYRAAMITAIKFLIHSDDDCEDVTQLDDETLEAMRVIVQGETRGMERSMQFHMGLPRISTKTNVSAVLRIQTLIRELDETKVESYDDYEIEEIIADQCMINSQFGIRWAKMMALGDEQDVKEQQLQEDDSTAYITPDEESYLEIEDFSDSSDDCFNLDDDDAAAVADGDDEEFC